MILGYLAGSGVISYSLQRRWLESFQEHFSIGRCQLTGAEARCRRGFDSNAIGVVAPCPPEPAAAGTPGPTCTAHLHLHLPRGSPRAPRMPCQKPRTD